MQIIYQGTMGWIQISVGSSKARFFEGAALTTAKVAETNKVAKVSFILADGI